MIALTPLEQALVAFTRHRDPIPALDRQQRADDAVMLAETEVFSIRQIISITGLPSTFAYELLAGKNERKEGGRLNPDTLQQISEIAAAWKRYHAADKKVVKAVVDAGTSPRMIHQLTGIHYNTIYAWVRKETNALELQRSVDTETPNTADSVV